MSSSLRTIQRAAKRGKHYQGRGSRLGYTNPQSTDLLARIAREAKRELSNS